MNPSSWSLFMILSNSLNSMYKLRGPCTRNVGYFLGMYVLSHYHTVCCLDISFVISNEIVLVCFKICAPVHTTAKLKVIRKAVMPKAVEKTLTGFWIKRSGVIQWALRKTLLLTPVILFELAVTNTSILNTFTRSPLVSVKYTWCLK